MATDENQAEVIGRNLWGDPVYRIKRVRGRPPFEWTEENSFKVSMLLAAGWTNERIAGTVLDPRTGKPISVPTLQRYFRSELDVRGQARDQLLAKQMMVAAQSAFAGNVGAQRLLVQLMEKNDLALLEARHRRKPDEAKPEEPVNSPPPPVGKKAQRIQAAQDMPSDYGDIFQRRRDRLVQ